MAENSKIEWTDATWNPVRARRHSHPGGPVTHVGWHCEKVSAGCDNCYAQGINLRLGTKLAFKPGHLAPRGEVEVFLDEKMLLAPLRWKKPRMIFVNSMTDSFGRFVTDEMLDRMFAVMALTPQHTFQVLTKRPERMRAYMTRRVDGALHLPNSSLAAFRVSRESLDLAVQMIHEGKTADFDGENVLLRRWPLPNVWLGTSVEDQATADARIPELLSTPAAVRFISAEPLLGPVILDDMCDGWKFHDALRGNWWHDSEPPRIERGKPKLDWVIVGGESGPGARPMHPDWARGLRDQCVAAGVPFFFKQNGEWVSIYDRDRDDPDWRNVPKPGDWDKKRWLNLAGGQGFHGDKLNMMHRVGKKRAGRLLDGRTWDQMPGVAG